MKGIFTPEEKLRWEKPARGYINSDLSSSDHSEKSLNGSKEDGYFKTILRTVGRNIFKYPLAAIGLLVILILVIVAVGTVIAYPYEEAVAYWHGEHWMEAPRLARPVWFNLFRKEKLPQSVFFDSTGETQNGVMIFQDLGGNENMQEVLLTFDFDFKGDIFPQDLIFNFSVDFEDKAPFSLITLITPDGRELELKKGRVIDRMNFAISDQDNDRINKPKEFTAIQKVFEVLKVLPPVQVGINQMVAGFRSGDKNRVEIGQIMGPSPECRHKVQTHQEHR